MTENEPLTSDDGQGAPAPADGSTTTDPSAGTEERDYLDDQADAAEDFLHGLLDILDMDGEAEADIADDDTIDVRLEGPDLAVLIGRGGATLDALQDLTRGAVHTKTGERALLTLDIAGYRDKQKARLERTALEAADRATREGSPVPLEPMSAFERLIIHQTLADNDAVTTSSAGEEPDRYVVVSPA